MPILFAMRCINCHGYLIGYHRVEQTKFDGPKTRPVFLDTCSRSLMYDIIDCFSCTLGSDRSARLIGQINANFAKLRSLSGLFNIPSFFVGENFQVINYIVANDLGIFHFYPQCTIRLDNILVEKFFFDILTFTLKNNPKECLPIYK